MYGTTAKDIAMQYGIDSNKAASIVQSATRIADQAVNDGYGYNDAVARYNTFIEKKARLVASTIPQDCIGVQVVCNPIKVENNVEQKGSFFYDEFMPAIYALGFVTTILYVFHHVF